jgi:5-methylcytosine-specific restriction endonuclease McrA
VRFLCVRCIPVELAGHPDRRSGSRRESRRIPGVGAGLPGCIQFPENSGHLVEVRLPDEIPAAGLTRDASRAAAKEESAGTRPSVNFEGVDFMKNKPLRNSIHAREREQCFYCLRRTPPSVQCLDHVVPLARSGRNSYRNLVSSCMECNTQKGETAAADFLRRLYREPRLTAAELAARLRTLDALISGKLCPSLPN